MSAPTIHRPFLNGVYTVSAGLFRLGVQPIPWREDGAAETHTFALDGEYGRYVESKWPAHRRVLHEYAGEANLSPDLREAALTFAAHTLAANSGGAITWNDQTFRNTRLGWEARLDLCWNGLHDLRRFDAPLAQMRSDLQPTGALDFLDLNAQEDLAILACDPHTGPRLAGSGARAVPRTLERDFGAVHAPVAGAEPLNAAAPRLVEAVITRGPFTRFAWGVDGDDRLHHRPAALATPELATREAVPFDPETAFVRVERQTLTGFPAAHGALFTIQPQLYPPRAAALRPMTLGQQIYKGLQGAIPALLIWLDRRAL